MSRILFHFFSDTFWWSFSHFSWLRLKGICIALLWLCWRNMVVIGFTFSIVNALLPFHNKCTKRSLKHFILMSYTSKNAPLSNYPRFEPHVRCCVNDFGSSLLHHACKFQQKYKVKGATFFLMDWWRINFFSMFVSIFWSIRFRIKSSEWKKDKCIP